TRSQNRPTLVQRAMAHACESETSIIMALHPKLVGPIADLPDVPVNFGFEPAYRGWISDDRTKMGHMGAPRHANPEKGEHLFRSYAEGVAAFLQKVADWNGKSWLPEAEGSVPPARHSCMDSQTHDPVQNQSREWQWWIAGLLLLATMINHMDLQTLSNLSVRITTDFS